MRLSTITADEVSSTAVQALGLDERSFGLDYPEAIAASLRRAASFLAPTTPRALVDTVLETLRPVLNIAPTRDELMETVDQLVSIGDLIELTSSIDGQMARLLYLGPPSFMERSPGNYLLIGVRPLGAPLLGADYEIRYEGFRRILNLDAEGAEGHPRTAGLHKISASQWSHLPSVQGATAFLEEMQLRVGAAREAGFVDGLTIIDPAASPTYYRGRWRQPQQQDSGDFVGRRPQAYGADRWCVVRLSEGIAERLLDLPIDDELGPTRDDAWRLQAAIDSRRGAPQRYKAREHPGTTNPSVILDFFSPIPTWAERYLGLIGTPVDKSRGALFSYTVPNATLPMLESMLTETLWMRGTIDGNE